MMATRHPQHSEFQRLCHRYGLTEEEVLKPASTLHLQEIARSHCRKWRALPVYLDMEDHLIWEDIVRNAADEEERRNMFFIKWQNEKASDATYKSLIGALLMMKSKKDAEYICELLKTPRKPAEG